MQDNFNSVGTLGDTSKPHRMWEFSQHSNNGNGATYEPNQSKSFPSDVFESCYPNMRGARSLDRDRDRDTERERERDS